MTVGVKYCGGCNPRYNRTGLVKRLEEAFPTGDFPPARPGISYDALLVVCGCPVQCAGTCGLSAAVTVPVVGERDYDRAIEAIRRAYGSMPNAQCSYGEDGT